MAHRTLCALAAACATVGATASTVTPIQKVLELMGDMKAKGISEKEAEATRFSAFDQWCQDKSRTVTDEINAGTERIEALAAKIEKDQAHIRRLTSRIEELDEDMSRWARDKKSATDVRGQEAADYRATSLDYGESLSALDEAIATLKKQASKTEQASALLQVRNLKTLSQASKHALASFLQQPAVEEMPDEMLLREAPQAYGYESQSGGVIDMLVRLKDEFETKKYDLDKEEMTAQHAFEGIAQQLTDNTENAQHEVDKKTTSRAETQQNKERREGEKAQTEADRAEDQKYLDQTKGLCTQKTQDFEARQKLRGEELEAIAQAIEIISSESVAGSGDKHLPALLAQPSTALAQLRSSARSPAQARVAAFLTERAKATGSRMLAAIAQRVAADPFGKVKKMVKNLISQLVQEATQETEHKGWCDTELTTNKQTRDQKTEAVEELTAKKEDLTSLIAQLSQDIEDLTAAVQDLDKAMQEATEERAASKEKNAQTVADAKAAQQAVQQATAVLKDFYAKSAQATALAQQSPAEDAPETFDKPYQGLLPEGGNVVDFLEVILTDFARLESETSTSEQAEADTFDQFMFESRKDRALKENEKGHKTDKRSDSEQALAETDEELKLTQAQLDKAAAYYEKLRPTCVDSGITYEERVRRREVEIQSLQEALQILQGTDLS